MDYRIEKHNEIKMVGIKISTTNEQQAGYKAIPEMWQRFMADQETRNRLIAVMDSEPKGMIGANVYNVDPDDAQKFDYYIGAASTQQELEGFEKYTIPAMTWAVFPCKVQDIGRTEIQIITEWQPQSEYRVLNTGYHTGHMEGQAPDLEVYGIGDNAEVWVAVEKK